MQPWRVFNDVITVPTTVTVLGVRIRIMVIAGILISGSIGTLFALAGQPLIGGVFFGVMFLVFIFYGGVMARLDPEGALSERTQLRLIRRGLKHRFQSNY